jgi:hypothetical protein
MSPTAAAAYHDQGDPGHEDRDINVNRSPETEKGRERPKKTPPNLVAQGDYADGERGPAVKLSVSHVFEEACHGMAVSEQGLREYRFKEE